MHDPVTEKIGLIDGKIDYYLEFHDQLDLRKLVNTQVAQDELFDYNKDIVSDDLKLLKAESQPLFYSFFSRMMGI